MSIPVNELSDFVIQNYNGAVITINIEDMRFIARQADAAADNSFYHRNKGLRFVWLSATSLLVLDESNPLIRKLTAAYNVSLATPPLLNFPFDLAFIAKTTTPSAALKLSEALQNVGYQGPMITNLRQVDMYIAALEAVSTGGGGGSVSSSLIMMKVEHSFGQRFYAADFPAILAWGNKVIDTSAGKILCQTEDVNVPNPGRFTLKDVGIYRVEVHLTQNQASNGTVGVYVILNNNKNWQWDETRFTTETIDEPARDSVIVVDNNFQTIQDDEIGATQNFCATFETETPDTLLDVIVGYTGGLGFVQLRSLDNYYNFCTIQKIG
jgi:hypothetical protein